MPVAGRRGVATSPADDSSDGTHGSTGASGCVESTHTSFAAAPRADETTCPAATRARPPASTVYVPPCATAYVRSTAARGPRSAGPTPSADGRSLPTPTGAPSTVGPTGPTGSWPT